MTFEPAFDDDGQLRSHAVFQPWGHGPIGMVAGHTVQACCWECGWVGPDRTGDQWAVALLVDDVIEHAHAVGANCGMCAACQGEA